MACQIVIPMSGSDRIEEVLPYLESVAQPKMKVVFLIHVGLCDFNEITAQLLAGDPGCARNKTGELGEQPSGKQVQPRCAALRAAGMEIIVSVFTGPWREALREYARNEEVHLVMMRGKAGNRWSRAWRRALSLVRRLRAERLPPVLLFHPSSLLGRIR